MQTDEQVLSRIRDILRSSPKGTTIDEVARKLPLNRTSTAKYLNTLLISGQAEMRTIGRAKLFSATKRVPFSRMLSLSSDPVLIVNTDGTVKDANDSFFTAFPLERKGVLGKPPCFIHFQEEASKVRDALNGVESSSMLEFEEKGRVRSFFLKFIPIVFDEGGQGAAVVFEDITETMDYRRNLEWMVEERTLELKEANKRLLEEIEQHQAARSALETAENSFRRITESMFDLICEIDPEGRFLYVTPSYRSVLGYTIEELSGKRIIDLIHSEDKRKAIAAYREFRSDKAGKLFEVRLRCEDGSYVWTESMCNPYFDSNGAFTGGTIVSRDITKRIRYQNELRYQVDIHHAVLAAIPHGYGLTDLDGRFIDTNNALCRITGYSREELLERSLEDLEPGDQGESRLPWVKGEGGGIYTASIRRKNGEVFPAQVSATLQPARDRIVLFIRENDPPR